VRPFGTRCSARAEIQPAKLQRGTGELATTPQPEDLRVPPIAGASRDLRAPTRKVTRLTIFYVAEDRVLSEVPKGRTQIAWGAAPGLRSLFLFTPWRLLRRSRSRRQGMEAIGATSTWGCAPGCPSAPLRDSMQRRGGDSTRKVTTRHQRTCHNPTTRRLARFPQRRRSPGPPRPNPQSYIAATANSPQATTRRIARPPIAGASRDLRAPTRKVTHLTVFYVAEDRVVTEAPKGRTTIAWGAAPGLRSLFVFTPWRLLRRSRSRRQGGWRR